MIEPVLASLAASTRPLLVCDVDEVILEFLDPFHAYLESVEHRLHPDSFRLHGNVRHFGGTPPRMTRSKPFRKSSSAPRTSGRNRPAMRGKRWTA